MVAVGLLHKFGDFLGLFVLKFNFRGLFGGIPSSREVGSQFGGLSTLSGEGLATPEFWLLFQFFWLKLLSDGLFLINIACLPWFTYQSIVLDIGGLGKQVVVGNLIVIFLIFGLNSLVFELDIR